MAALTNLILEVIINHITKQEPQAYVFKNGTGSTLTNSLVEPDFLICLELGFIFAIAVYLILFLGRDL